MAQMDKPFHLRDSFSWRFCAFVAGGSEIKGLLPVIIEVASGSETCKKIPDSALSHVTHKSCEIID